MKNNNFSNSTLCPHCKTKCQTINTAQITDTYREVRYACKNFRCGFIFTAAITPMRTIMPSMIPNHKINIPLLLSPPQTEDNQNFIEKG